MAIKMLDLAPHDMSTVDHRVMLNIEGCSCAVERRMHWVQTLENRLAVEVEVKLEKFGIMCFVGNSAEILTIF
jgi:hypothetical protein